MEKYKKIIIILLMVFSVTHLFAQDSGTINGKVTDENGSPLAGVTVIGDEGDVFTFTDKEGKFTISLLFSDIVLIEKAGYVSKQISVQAIKTNSNIALVKTAFLTGEKNTLQLPFRQLEARRSVGSTSLIDVNELRNYDSRNGINSALNGRVAGLIGDRNIWGRGDAILVIDGMPRVESYVLNLMEVESITVLKDPVSRSLYGAMSDQGVIMVKTKRGKAFKKELNFQAEYGISQPISNTYPKYMNAADYMETINGLSPNKYSAKQIEETRKGVNPAIYPDLDLYSSDFLYSQNPYHSIFAESSGGNKAAQYYLNVGWQRSNGWLKIGDRETTDKLNIRGNVDYQLTNNFRMTLDAGALVNINKSSNIKNYWKTATTVLPNSYPLYWDPAIITDPAKRTEILSSAMLLPNGMLPGGNKTYTSNFYNDIFKKGDKIIWERNLQVNVGAEWDLKGLLPGLKAKGYLALDAYNVLYKNQNGKYAVYNPLLLSSKINGSDSISVETIGENQKVSNFATVKDSMDFNRRIGAYASLAYDKSFEETDVSLMAVAYRDQLAVKGGKQEKRNLTFGLNGNIIHKKKYILDFSLGLLGSQKLSKENRLTFTPSLGLGWILSEEDFLSNSEIVDFLKVRSSAAILKNDNWKDYWLYTELFKEGGKYSYNNDQNSNNEREIISLSSNIGWQKRKELVLGLDASLFQNKLWLETSVFYTERYDTITQLKNMYPLLAGTESKKYYGNYNADRIQGFDIGLKYCTQLTNDLSLTVGSNLVLKSEKILKRDEPNHNEPYLFAVGTASNSHWGLASDGLYGANDFDANGKLLSNLPVPSWGQVAPGDIKYKNWNNDNVINSDDEHIIGLKGANLQYSVYFNLRYKKFELYVICVGYQGGNNMRSSDYYRPYGFSMKYPEHIKQAYSSSNPDVNALYPRLTETKSSHNFRDSDFWMYNANSFTIPTLQLTYNFIGKSTGVIRNAKIYLRGNDIYRYNPKPEYANLSLNEPKTFGLSLGGIFMF